MKPSEIANTSEMQAKFAAAREAAEALGFHYVVITERVIGKRGSADIEEMLAIRRRSRTRSLGIEWDSRADDELVPVVPPALAAAAAHGKSMSMAEAMRLLGGGEGAMNELKTLLAFRVLAWHVDEQLNARSRIYQPLENDDEELFV